MIGALPTWLPDADDRRAFTRWALIALALHLAAAVFTEGWYAYDEHWQIIEFANYILGRTPRSELAWEFAAHARPSLQPFIYAGMEKVLLTGGVSSPFVIAAVFRASTSLVAWLATVLAGLAGISWLGASPLRRWVMPALTLTWFIPYLHARTSSENASETAFVLGFALLTLTVGSGRSPSARMSLLIGALFGLACEFRYQVGLMVVGALLWCVWIARPQLAVLAAMAGGLLLSLAIATYADRSFYDAAVLAPWNYFRVNIIEHRASSYGTAPWWSYFRLMFEKMGPPLSLVIMAGVAGAWLLRPFSLGTWSMVPFLLVHMVLGHKEFRFLYPLATLSVLVTVRSLDDARIAWPSLANVVASRWWARVLVGIIVIEDLGLLGVATFRPSQATMPLYRHIYAMADKPTTIYFHGDQLYQYGPDLKLRFYRPPNVDMVTTTFADLEKAASLGAVWYVEHGFDLPSEAGALTRECEPESRSMPIWVRKININHWVDRTPVWTLFRCRATSG